MASQSAPASTPAPSVDKAKVIEERVLEFCSRAPAIFLPPSGAVFDPEKHESDAAREISGLPFSCLGTRSLPPWLRNPQKVGGKTVWPPKLYYGWVLRKRTGEKPRPQFVNTTVNPPQAVDFYQIKTVYCKGGNLTNILVRECNYALPKEEAPFGWMTEDDFKVLEDYYEDARPGEKKPRTGGWYVSYKQGEDAYNAEFCWTSKPKPAY